MTNDRCLINHELTRLYHDSFTDRNEVHTPKEKNQGTSTISDYLTQWSPEDADNHAEENLLLIPRSNRFDGTHKNVPLI